MNMSTIEMNQIFIARKGLNVLFKKCNPETYHENNSNARIHLFSARTISNLAKHKQNRTLLYKKELERRSKESREIPLVKTSDTNDEKKDNIKGLDSESTKLRKDFSSWFNKSFENDEDDVEKKTNSITSKKKKKNISPKKPNSPRKKYVNGGRKGKYTRQLIDLNQGLRKPMSSIWSPSILQPLYFYRNEHKY